MVSIESTNIYDLRNFLLQRAINKAESDPLKIAFLISLNILPNNSFVFDNSSISLYQKCAISGLNINQSYVSINEFTRLLGQAPIIDGTPRPWVSDIWGILGVKFAIDALNNDNINRLFATWINGFLPERIKSGRLTCYEVDIARYVSGKENLVFSSSCIALYLHYKNLVPLSNYETKQKHINTFFNNFKEQFEIDLPSLMLALYVHVFDQINKETSLVPPNNWELVDLLNFLEKIPSSMKRWTWEDKGRTSGANPRKWYIENEYHVQNLLYVMLAPIFEGICDEENLESVGQKNPRADLYLPSIHTIIEVKYRKDNRKSFSALIGEIAEDISLYRADPKYKDCQLVCFLWDHTRSTQEHVTFKSGVLKMPGIQGCVVVNSPSNM